MRTAPRPRPRRALGAVSWLPFGRVAARTGRVADCVARARAPCRRPLRSRYKNCITTQTSARRVAALLHHVTGRSCVVSHGAPAPCRRALLRCIVAPSVLCRDARPPSCHDTNDRIVTHLSGQAMCARSAASPERRPVVSQVFLAVSWSCHDMLLALSWPCHDVLLAISWPPCCAPSPALSRYNLLYRDPAHNENGQ